MQGPVPFVKDLVFVGGGHTHALVLRHFAMKPVSGVRLTVINPGPTAPYSGMLPGFIAGHYGRDDLDIDLVRLGRMANARVILGRAEGIDQSARLIHIAGRPPLGYDIAALDIGITSEMPNLPGFAEHAHPAKPLGAFAIAWERFAASDTAKTVAVIGGGVAGVELSLAMAYRLRGQGAQITLIEAGSEILRDTLPRTRAVLTKRLLELGVRILTGAGAEKVGVEGVTLTSGHEVEARFVTGSAVARPQGWLSDTDLALTDGFVTVDPMLRSSDPAIYAVGDCAHMAHAPRPKAGVYAVRQAPTLYHNLRADLTGGARRRYDPQSGYLKLISVGGKDAVADKFGITVQGPRWWRLKDRIDAKFMQQFRDLRPMSPLPPTGDLARGVRDRLAKGPDCAGCGGKVSASALTRVLAAQPTADRPDVVRGMGDDAALLRTATGAQALSVDHLSALWADPYVFGRIAAVHALGDVWSMGAQPQAVLVTALLPNMTEHLQERTLREVMAGVGETVREAGADVIGGHSATASELSLGVTVTGLIEGPMFKGAGPGDALILTKPLGVGTVMAAEMRGLARGEEVVAALSSMQRSMVQDAAILSPRAHAMTDVTGFGLAGHLASFGVGAELYLATLPILPGAERLAEQGLRSSLYSSNVQAAPVIGPSEAKASLLHDPQTAGGLLAAVPEEVVEDILAALPHAVRIGTVIEGPQVTILR